MRNWRHSRFVSIGQSTVSGWKQVGMVMAKTGKPPTTDDWFSLWITQAGSCGVCGNPLADWQKPRSIAIVLDHDHATGLVRGILCQSCNSRLGKAFTHMPTELAESAERYLANPPAQRGIEGVQLILLPHTLATQARGRRGYATSQNSSCKAMKGINGRHLDMVQSAT